MEPTGTTAATTATTATTTPGVLAAQDAIVFSGAGAEGVTPPVMAPTVAPAVAPTDTDVFWASLVQAQLCVWELQGAIEGQPDGGHHDRPPRGSWDHGHGATAGSAAMARSISHQRRGPGSTEESISHQHVCMDGSISPKFMATDGNILHEHQGHGTMRESIFHVSTGGTITREHQGHVPTEGSISPMFIPMENISPMEKNLSPMFMPVEKNISPMEKNLSPASMPVEKNISPEFMPTDESTFHEHQGHGSTYKSIFHMSTDGTISPRSVPMDGSVFHEQQGWRFAYENISHVSMGGSISNEHRGHVPTDGSISPKSVSIDGSISPMSIPVDDTILQEHVPTDGTVSPKATPMDVTTSSQSVPMDGIISPKSMPMGGTILQEQVPMDGNILPKATPMDTSISRKTMPMDGTISPKAMPTDGTMSPKFMPMDGTISPKAMPTDGTMSPKFMPMDGTISPKAMPTDGTNSPKAMPTDGSISPRFMPTDGTNSPKAMPTDGTMSPKFMPTDGTILPKAMPMDGTTSPKFMPTDGTISPKFMPMDGTISPKAMPTDGTMSPKFMPMDGTNSPKAMPTDGTMSPKFMPMDGTTSPKAMPTDGTTSPKFMPTDGTISPKFMPTDGTTSPKHRHPEFSEEEEEGDDEDDHGCSSREENAEEEEDLEEEEPHFHTNPLFQSRVPPPMGPRRVPIYRPHSAALQPLLITEGDDTGGATGEGRGGVSPPQSPPPFGCHPVGGDITTAVEQGHPLELSDSPDVPPGCGDPPSPLRLQPEWGYRDPPAPSTPLEFILVGGDRDPPGPGYPPVVEGPPPVTPSPHPAMEELPPETGEEPPPDPPASTHGSPPGGSAVTAALAKGGRGEAQRLAARLYHLRGFKRSQVAAFLRKNNDFSRMVAQEYLEFFQFGGQTLDQALRSFLQALVLTGETQERERILGHFSRRYHRCNPGAFPSPDAVHSLTCAIMLLNTDLHGQRLGRAMTSAEFVANLSGMMDGQDFPREQLKALYSSIRSEKLAWAADEEEEEEEEETGGLGGSPAPPGRKKSNPFLDLPGGTGAVTYRRGWLARKVLAEADGKKTPWGRRSWKPFQAVLKGTVLYFLKPGGRTGVPRRPPEPGLFPTPQEEEGAEAEEPLGVHHALAERASKYTKRPNVFRLQTADWRVFLFQAPTQEEMFSWISRINLVAALFSSPPFPAAVGSQRRFVRPILPAAPSRSPPEEQHRSHEAWMERVAQELFEHQRNLPEKRGRARDLDEYRLKKEYLLYERRRYETYVQVLETWISAGAQDLEGWEAQAGPAAAPPDLPTLTKAHSSPSLVPEPPIAPTIRVKRNISERRTVRKIVPKRNKNLL